MCKNDTFDLESLSYSIIYLALVVYTFMFTFIYIRRVLTMAFLTMIAPLIAVTYPLDKIKDGRAQAYEIWIKEYTFNALIQPVHLIIYILTVSNVMNTIKDHPMFALIAMGFLLPAEKFIRKMFGFDRAETLNALGKAAGGAAIMSGVKQLSSLGKRHTSNEEKEDKDDTVDYDGEEFEEAYLFESELFELEMLQETYNMHNAIRKSLLLEVEGYNNLNNTQKIADKANVWQNIISKLISLWKKFKEAVFTTSKSKIEYLKKNESLILTSKVSGKVKLSYGVGADINKLQNIKIPDLNYQAMENDLVNAETFCKTYFKEYYEEGKSISDSIKEKLLGKPYEDLVDVNQIRPTIKDAYDFCVNYPDKVEPIRKQTDLMDKAQRVAKNISKVEESANTNDFAQYFSEMEGEVSEEDKKENEASNKGGDKSAKLTVYFKVCSQVLAAEMTVYQKWFNELYKFCVWYIKAANPDKTPEEIHNKEESFN